MVSELAFLTTMVDHEIDDKCFCNASAFQSVLRS
jgi:hypothetical protein